MNRGLDRKKRSYLIIGLCAILLVMSIGYAAFSSLLTINGTASLTDSFCVGFDNTKLNTYTPTAGITNGTIPTGSMSYSGTACSTKYQPNSSLSATFKQPGDKIEYTLTIANKSTFTVAIESILVENQNVTSNTTITKGNIKYMVEMPLSTTLASNAETTMKVTAMFQNDTDVTGQYNGESQTLNVKINAEQGDSGFTPTPATFTGTIYRNNTNILLNGKTMNGEVTIYYSLDKYSSAEEALFVYGDFYSSESECDNDQNDLEASSGCASGTVTLSAGNYVTDPSEFTEAYYLKHDIVDNIITNSYACFVTDTEHCMQGGNASYYAANKTLLQSLESWFNNNSGRCYFGSDSAYCYDGLLWVEANSNGRVLTGPTPDAETGEVYGSCVKSNGSSDVSDCYEE